MNTANESQKKGNLNSRRSVKCFALFVNTIPNGNYLVHFAQCFLLRREMQRLFVHCGQGSFLEKEE